MKIEVEPKTCAVVQCLEKNCRWNRVCANHYTAGDFRTEGGARPILSLRAGEVFCETMHSEGDGCEYHELPLKTASEQSTLAGWFEMNCVLWKDLEEETHNYQI